jgi:hypothetical protein
VKLGEMFVELNFKADTYKVKDFAKTISNIPFSLAAAGAALVGMDIGFMALTSSTLDMANSLLMFKAQTGQTTDELERWQMVARRVGVGNEVVTGSFQRMMSAIAQLKTFGTGPAGEMFGRLGIHGFMEKTPYQLMDELRAKYKSMDPLKFSQIAGNLIDPAMMRVFQSPLSEPSRRERLSPLYGAAGQASAADLTRALSEVADIMRGEFLNVFKQIEPDLRSIAEFLGFIVRGLGWTADKDVKGYKGLYELFKSPSSTLKNIAGLFIGNPDPSTNLGMWHPVNHAVTVNQHFYGDVDRQDIDAGTLSLEHSLIRASRQLNKSGR